MPRIPQRITQQGSTLAPTAVPVRPPALGFEQSSDRQVNDLQKKIAASVAPARFNPFADGNLLEQVFFAIGTSTPLLHGLQKRWRGYILTRADADATFKVDLTQGGEDNNLTGFLDAKQISLVASDNVTADVWVFG